MNLFESSVNFLNDPKLVANVQSAFGLKFHSIVNDPDSKDVSQDNEINKESSKTDTKSDKNLKKVKMLRGKICQFKIESKFFYYFFNFVTHMGNEVFYIVFLPILLWNFNEKILLLTAVCWSLTMYIGQGTKDLIKMPRPQTPPVIKLEEKYLLEYGFPSTHSMAAMSISFTIISLIFNYTEVRVNYEDYKVLLLICAIISCFLVSLSRVYLGMHSVLDVVGGLLYAFLISFFFVSFSDNFLNFIKQSSINGGLFYLMMVLLCVLYPCKDRWSSARSDTFLILGVGAGVAIAYSLKASFKWLNVGQLRYVAKGDSALNKSKVISMRIFLGLFTLLIVRNMSKKIFYWILRFRPNLSKISGEQLKEHIKKNFSLDLCFYFFTYSNVGFTAVFTCFVLFEYFKLY